MTCEHARAFLSAYFDRELDVGQNLEIAAHLGECRRCAAALEQQEALRTSLRGASLTFAPPLDLEHRVRTALRRAARAEPRFVRPYWRWAAVPAAAVLAAALTWSVIGHRGPSGEELVLADLVSGHIRSLMVDHLVDVATTDQHTVRPWFNGKVDFAPPVTDFAASGFALVGGRVDYIAGRAAAVIVYKRRQHLVNVFIWPSDTNEDHALRPLTFQGYQLLSWSRSGLTFWAVSDVNRSDLETLAHLIQESP